MRRVLVLAGTAEARALCAELAETAGVAPMASLAGETERPAAYACETRVGGFGGAAGLAAHLRADGVEALIDATHPFAAQISANAARAAAESGVPLLRLERPPWTPRADEDWREADTLAAAAAALPAGARAFLATGRKSLPVFAGRPDVWFAARVVDPPTGPSPLPNGKVFAARPPFDLAAETALFRRLKITHLVAKNAGGAEGRAKLRAAAALDAPILMVRRPPPTPGVATVETVAAALAWLGSLPG